MLNKGYKHNNNIDEMRKKLTLNYWRVIVIFVSLMISSLSFGQNRGTIITDTLSQKNQSIETSEVSIKSGEVIIKTQRLYESLISEEDINLLVNRNDSILALLDSVLIIDRQLELASMTTRTLSNKLVYWKGFADLINKEKNDLAYEINILSDYKKDNEEDISLWLNTKKIIQETESELPLIERVDMLLSALDSLKTVLIVKTDRLLISLNSTTREGVLIDDFIARIDQTYIDKKNEIFVQNEPSLFSIDYSDPSKTSFIEPVTNFYNTEVKDMFTYISNNISNMILQLLLLLLLIILFKQFKKRLLTSQIVEGLFYRKMLVKIMSRSISVALIIAIFISMIFFTDRPELLREVILLLIAVPIMLISMIFGGRKFYYMIYLFGMVIVLNIIYIAFPPDNLYYILLLLVAAIIEIFILSKLIQHFYRKPFSKPIVNSLIILVLLVNLGAAIMGFAGLLYGSTTLAELAINVPVANAFSGLLAFSLIIILNGLISFAIDSQRMRKLYVIRTYGDVIKKWSITIVNIVFGFLWIRSVMTQVNAERPIAEAITGFLTDKVSIGEATFTLGNIIMFFFVIWLSIVVSRIIRVLLEHDILDKFRLAKGVPHTIAIMVRYSIITIGVLLAVTAAGLPLSSITVMAGAFGVGIGFGLQHIFNNIVSGFILLFERPIQIGDTIEVGQMIGKVKSIGIRSSNIKTFDGADVIVPNGQLISNEVINWTLSDKSRRIEVVAGVAYGSDPHKVKALFETVLQNHKDILDDPEPSVFFQGLGDSSLDFRLLFWTSNYPEWIRIRSDIVFGVHDILVKEDINIPFPQMDLHLKSVDKSIDLIKKSNK